MAKFQVDGLATLIQELEQDKLYGDEVAEEILFAMADEMVAEAKSEMAKSPFRLDRISEKVGYSKRISSDKKGVKFVRVGISGKNARGEDNALVAFVLNYGRSEKYGEIKGGYFWTRATRQVKARAKDIAEKKAEEYYKAKGLI